jgi:hypothetical protein
VTTSCRNANLRRGSELKGVTAVKISAVVFSLFVASKLCSAAEPSGEFVELHSCDLYTGGCTASAESTLLGRQVFRAWSIESGQWNGQDLTHLKVAVLETGSKNLAEKGALADKAEIFVPRGLAQAKREALLSWAAAQHPLPRATPVIEAEIIYQRSGQEAAVTVGDTVSLTTMAIGRCGSGACGQALWYEPQADHSTFEVVASRTSKIQNATLFWADHDRPNVFLASFGSNPSAGQLAGLTCH